MKQNTEPKGRARVRAERRRRTSVSLADYKGKVVLLNFWATWCGPCKIEIPWFIEFEQKYKDRGFAVLGVAMDEEGLGSRQAVSRPDKHKLQGRGGQ